jgi:long-chain fatty acid transport protein
MPPSVYRRILSFVLPSCAFVVALLPEGHAVASGYLTARYGGDSGAPMNPNTYAVYFNPAALGGTSGTTITGDLSLALRQAGYTRTTDALSPVASNRERLLADPKYVSANTGDASLLNLLALPFAGVNTDFGTKSLRFGYAVYIPFGGTDSWDRTRGAAGAPGSTDGVQRWHDISGQLLAIYNTFAFAYAVGDTGLSIGASVSPVIHRVATVRARTGDDTDEIEFQNGALKEGRSYLEATAVNVQATGGLYWQGHQGDIRVGAAYLSQPGFGTTRMTGTLEGRTSAGDVTQNIDVLQAYPDIVRLGFAYRIRGAAPAEDAAPPARLELRTDAEYVRWSVLERQCVVLRGKDCNVDPNGGATGNNTDVVLNFPRSWHDAVGYRAGVGYFVNDKVEVAGQVGFSTSAVPKAYIDASSIDSFQLLFSAGVRYVASRHLALGGNYTHLYFLPVDTSGANHFDQFAKPSQSPNANGKYSSQIGLLNVSAAYTF